MMDALEKSLGRRWRDAEIQLTGGHGKTREFIPMVSLQLTDEMVPKYKLDATKAILAERERELLELKGPCTTTTCPLHHEHSGPCNCL